ncbi:MAG: hypothetical protein OXN44_09460, partial [Acidimicrobiaceae bacterium]|nr:hypothetical protein [Acidimicrobiaceae bacterium]
ASPAPAADLDVTVTVTAAGDYGITTGVRTVTVPASGSVTLTVATVDDQTDEPDGTVTATVQSGSGYTVSTTQATATVGVADDDDPPVVDGQDKAALEDCGAAKPSLSISSPEASRSDATVDFEVSLDCRPATRVMVLLLPVRDGEIGNNILVFLTSQKPTATITLTIGGERQLGLTIGWAPGIANRTAQGNVAYTD